MGDLERSVFSLFLSVPVLDKLIDDLHVSGLQGRVSQSTDQGQVWLEIIKFLPQV
jgi:hypothetical protein